MRLTPPSNARIEAATGSAVSARSTIDQRDLSHLERLCLHRSDADTTAVLKTTCPALAHERRAYTLVQDHPICAAELIAAGDCSQLHDTWLLLSDVPGLPFEDVTAVEAAQALADLGHMHRAFLGRSDLLTHLPRRDLPWLAEHADETVADLLQLVSSGDLELDEASIQAYRQRLLTSAARRRDDPLTLMHGDFDPGNLVRLASGRFAALDWGLSHLNTPLVDLAHMAERFSPAQQHDLAERFLCITGLSGYSPEEALTTGLVWHRAFFVRWHTRAAAKGWIAIETVKHSIEDRVEYIARGG
ncbi:MAG TPA: aminoglycoside phosphotransferase family protein [Candidatus Latescibacteria bacterium]|nr:aminoglycoside phosphotransferase family protein [Candidatus Latescibacterota bacterium]HJP30391.1 aminoglycoside phosphotransferase family protein [Candidatus Latescibacterota bacterium]